MDFQGNWVAKLIKTIKLICSVTLLLFVAGVAQAEGRSNQLTSQNAPLAAGDEETVTLPLGTTDNEQYGRNYGRDKNNFRLDVSFTPTPDRDHSIQWQAFDIESDEMEVFLNDVKIKTIPQTTANQLGSLDRVDVPAANLGGGSNVLSFRVTGGNETWGITSLRVDAAESAADDEAATTVLLDAPDELQYGASTRSYTFNFDFTPRGDLYRETILISFDTRLLDGTRNGFNVSLNGSTILRIATYRGRATFINRQVSLDKSDLNIGGNSLRISTTAGSSLPNTETKIANVKVENQSEPLADVSVVSLRLADESSKGPFDFIASVVNVGVAASQANTVSFFRSANEDLSAPVSLSSQPLATLVAAGVVEVVASIESAKVKSGEFYWACVDLNEDEADTSNDCSPPIVVERAVAPLAGIIMLLTDD